MSNFFITGISTDVGKTVVSAIVTQALHADYWKALQSGGMDHSDRSEVQRLVSNDKTQYYEESYFLNTPMSPHKSAQIDGVTIDIDQIKRPETDNHLVIEGAGGILVPLNDTHTVADLIMPDDKVILVSSGYLGSINHTLLSIEYLKSKGLKCAGVLYNQVTLSGTIEIIEKMTSVPTIGHIDTIVDLNAQAIEEQAQLLRPALHALI
jgi:dethiobiotin synthetase